ncbi:hypothetical protein [Aeromicrobium sp.]|uniref:hypothetical protein n=1 Tax=Aeromicrobium sp. TaxID=1871063 RepID=UPI00351428C5
MPRLVPSLLSAALAGLLALAVATGELWLVAVGVLVVQVLVATAPAHGAGERPRPTTFVPVVAGSVVATAVAWDPQLLRGTDGTVATEDALISAGVFSGVMLGSAVVVFAGLVGQMLRRDGRQDLVRAVAATVLVGVVATSAAGWVAASGESASIDVVAMAAAALSVALLVWSVPGDRVLLGSGAVTAGALTGVLVSATVEGTGTWVLGLAVGGAAAGCALLGQVLGRAWSVGALPGPQTWAFPAAVSVALVGPAVHVGASLAVLTV